MTDEEREARDWPENWLSETGAAVRVAEQITAEMIDTAWEAFQSSAGTSATKMRAALEAAALTSRKSGELHALRTLANEAESTGLGEDLGGIGLAAFLRERADRIEARDAP